MYSLVSLRKQVLVIASGHFISDLRSYELIRQILQTDGYVTALSGAVGLGRLESLSRFVGQGGVETAVFVERLVERARNYGAKLICKQNKGEIYAKEQYILYLVGSNCLITRWLSGKYRYGKGR